MPLPSLVVPPSSRSCSRVVQRRRDRLRHSLAWANDGINTLNSMAGLSSCMPGVPGAAGRKCLDHLRDAYVRAGPPPDESSSCEGALSALLSSSAVYGDGGGIARPYSKDTVSWPCVGSTPVELSKALPAADRWWLDGWRERMLASADEQSHATSKLKAHKPFTEPSLMDSCRTYGSFLDRLQHSGMLKFRVALASESGVLGVFFVPKKDNKTRLIFDTRFLNCKFRVPPSTLFPLHPPFLRLSLSASLVSHCSDLPTYPTPSIT